jgi:hypothetical protein
MSSMSKSVSPSVSSSWCRASSQSHVMTDGQSGSQSVSLGVDPHLGLMTSFTICQTVGRPLWMYEWIFHLSRSWSDIHVIYIYHFTYMLYT